MTVQPAFPGQPVQSPPPQQNRSRWQLLLLLLLLGGVVALLVWLLRPGAVCGDGSCDRDAGETYATCPSDCESKCGDGLCDASKESAATCPADCKAACGDGRCDAPGETAATCPKDCAVCGNGKCEAPSETAATCPKDCALCGNGKCDAGETAASCPEDCQPVGKCRNKAFRQMLAKIVKDCETACGVDSANPVVALNLAEFTSLFASSGDAGYGNYFALFGCNVWNSDSTDCKGFDSFYAEPSKCPADAAYECATRATDTCNPAGAQGRCQQYSKVIQDEFKQFATQWRDAKYFVLLGTASRSGNRHDGGTETMSVGNQKLALKRSGAVESLLARLRTEAVGGAIDGKAFKVALDNTKQFFDTAEFKTMIGKQLTSLAPSSRGFVPTSANAVNRSVLVVAIKCDLSDVGVK